MKSSSILASFVIVGITIIMSMFFFTCHKNDFKTPRPISKDKELMKEFFGK